MSVLRWSTGRESELLSNLAALDVPTNARTKQFARELMARSGAGGGGGGRAAPPTASQKREQESRAMAAKNDTFTMLKEPELDPAALKAAKKAQRKLRKRSAREEEEDDAPAAKRPTETEEERKVRLMDEDQAEMAAFSGRLKDRDDAKTKNTTLDEDKTGERLKELAQLKMDEREDHLKSLRVRSREDYLVKRTSQKLVELQADLKDEDYLYDGVKLTKKERIEKEMKQELLKLALEKQNMNFDEGGYNMPVSDLVLSNRSLSRDGFHGCCFLQLSVTAIFYSYLFTERVAGGRMRTWTWTMRESRRQRTRNVRWRCSTVGRKTSKRLFKLSRRFGSSTN